jgi:hypothetical protein
MLAEPPFDKREHCLVIAHGVVGRLHKHIFELYLNPGGGFIFGVKLIDGVANKAVEAAHLSLREGIPVLKRRSR